MGKPRRVKSVEEMEALWAGYKDECDNHTVMTHEFSQKLGKFVSEELNKPCTYTIKGFCVYMGMPHNNFYDTYAADPAYQCAISRIRDECEIDARQKFEGAQIPSQLSGLWMSRYGYGQNTTVKLEAEKLIDDWIKAVKANE